MFGMVCSKILYVCNELLQSMLPPGVKSQAFPNKTLEKAKASGISFFILQPDPYSN
jgi:hypothetical protein